MTPRLVPPSRTRGAATRLLARALGAAIAVACVAHPALEARAQSPADVAAARQAFKLGEEAEARGDLAIAVTRFQEALAIKATPQLYLRIGAVQEKLGRLVDALASYEHGLEKASGLPAVVKIAREQIDALQPRVPVVTLVVRAAPADLVITIDGAPVASSTIGTPLRVDPGTHRVHAQAPGFLPRDQTFSSNERGRARVELELLPADNATPTPVASAPPPSDTPSKVPGGVVTGLGVAALAAGIGSLAASFVKDAAIDNTCHGSARTACPLSQKASILSDVSTVNALRFAGIGIAAVGAAATGAGIYLLVRRPAAPPVGLVVVPTVGDGQAGILAAGRF